MMSKDGTYIMTINNQIILFSLRDKYNVTWLHNVDYTGSIE